MGFAPALGLLFFLYRFWNDRTHGCPGVSSLPGLKCGLVDLRIWNRQEKIYHAQQMSMPLRFISSEGGSIVITDNRSCDIL